MSGDETTAAVHQGHNGRVPHSPTDSSVDADRFSAIERWVRPLSEGTTWLALAFVVVSGVAAPVWFVLVLFVGLLLLPLYVVLFGRPFVAALFTFARSVTVLDASMALWAGHEVAVRPTPPIDDTSHRLLATEPERWRFVGAVAANALVAPVLTGVALAPAILAIVFLAVGLGWIGLPVYLALMLIWPRLIIATAEAKARLARWLAGPDRLAESERRVAALSEQRADILEAVADERRRIERNLHDGVQQHLVAIGLDLGRADLKFDDDPEAARSLIGDARAKVHDVVAELRQLGRGLHPAVLADRGLDAALSSVVARASIPIDLDIGEDLDLDPDVQATAYLIINEAVANVLKHSAATRASITVTKVGANVRIVVGDDGRGGAEISDTHGLAGLRARVAGVDGELDIDSPPGGPTTLTAEIPRHD